MQVVRDNSLDLIDTMPSLTLIQRIRAGALDIAGVHGTEKCRARKTSLQYHVDLHIEVDPRITVEEAHNIAERVRTHIRESLPEVADVLVHVEPSRELGGAPPPPDPAE